jgi:hypothetical protein
MEHDAVQQIHVYVRPLFAPRCQPARPPAQPRQGRFARTPSPRRPRAHCPPNTRPSRALRRCTARSKHPVNPVSTTYIPCLGADANRFVYVDLGRRSCSRPSPLPRTTATSTRCTAPALGHSGSLAGSAHCNTLARMARLAMLDLTGLGTEDAGDRSSSITVLPVRLRRSAYALHR